MDKRVREISRFFVALQREFAPAVWRVSRTLLSRNTSTSVLDAGHCEWHFHCWFFLSLTIDDEYDTCVLLCFPTSLINWWCRTAPDKIKTLPISLSLRVLIASSLRAFYNASRHIWFCCIPSHSHEVSVLRRLWNFNLKVRISPDNWARMSFGS